MTNQTLIFVGTYSVRGSQGIHVFALDPAAGALTELSTAASEHPSFLVLSPDNRFLYTVNEIGSHGDQHGGAVSAYAVQRDTGTLEVLNQAGCAGSYPCHLSIDPTGRWLVTSNYGDGTHTVFSVNPDGAIGNRSHLQQNNGVFGPGQTGAHAHCTWFSQDGQTLYACDLGLDQLIAYTLDPLTGELKHPNAIAQAAGAGPRHLTFHPSLGVAYLINELNSTVVALYQDTDKGDLVDQQTISTLPEGFDGENACADLHVTADGKFLLGSNRGHDSLVVYAINPATGMLTLLDHVHVGGSGPRNFAVLPDGLVLVANQHTDSIVAFRMDRDGIPRPTGAVTNVPSPVCVVAAI